MMKRVCSVCQAEAKPVAKFCKMCGALLPDVEIKKLPELNIINQNQEQGIFSSRVDATEKLSDSAFFTRSSGFDDLAWFYMINKKKVGPIPGFMVRDLVGLGDIVEDTLLWNPGLPEWKSASELGFVEAAAEVVIEEVKGTNEPESTPEQEWFISRAEEQFGPYTWAQIIIFSRDGNLNSDDYLWSASLPDWIRAADIEGLIK